MPQCPVSCFHLPPLFPPSLALLTSAIIRLLYISALLFFLPKVDNTSDVMALGTHLFKRMIRGVCKLKGTLHYLAAFVVDWKSLTERRQVMTLSVSPNWNIVRRSPQAWQDRCLLALERKQAKKKKAVLFKLIHAVQHILATSSVFLSEEYAIK